MTKLKFQPSEHEVLVKSSFIDYSQEEKTSFIASYFNRFTGALKSRWQYKTAEHKIRKQYPKVAKAQDLARLDGGLIGTYQWVRLLEIANFVKQYKVKTVCEFGSGGSTSMFSQLGLERFVSLEQNEKWAKKTKQCLPEGARVELLRKDRHVVDFDGEPCTRYDLPDDFYQQEFDLVYIDGPTAKPMNEEESELPILDVSEKMMPNIDIEMFFSKGFFPKLILVDARRATVRRLCEKYSDQYDIHIRYFYQTKYHQTGEFLYHTVFVRKQYGIG